MKKNYTVFIHVDGKWTKMGQTHTADPQVYADTLQAVLTPRLQPPVNIRLVEIVEVQEFFAPDPPVIE